MSFPTSSSRFDVSPGSKYEQFFNSINNGNLSDSFSVINESRTNGLDEFIQFIREGILTTDPNVCKQALPLLMIMADAEHRQDLYDRIRAVCRENGIDELKIEKTATLDEMLPGQITHITPEICRIKCLEQTSLQGGEETCGFHCLKNALIVMALTEGFPIDQVEQLFMNPQFYDNVEALACKERGEAAFGDASDAHIRLAWDAIVKNQAHPFMNMESPLNWNRKNLSVFGVGVNIRGEKTGLLTTDHPSIESLANLVELSAKKGPCRHTFIVGSEGHWVTVVYEKNEAQQVRWYGMDSLGDSQTNDHILDSIKWISDAMENIDSISPRLYYRSVGEDIERKAQWVNTSDATQLNHPDQVDMVKSAIMFMDRMGWLEANQEPLIEQFITDVKTLALYYRELNLKDPVLDKVLARETAQITPHDREIAKLELTLPQTKNIQTAFADLRKLPVNKQKSVMERMRALYSIGYLDLDEQIGNYLEFAKSVPSVVLDITQGILSENKNKRRELLETLRIQLDEILDPIKARYLADALLENVSLFTQNEGEIDSDAVTLLNDLIERATLVQQRTTKQQLNIQNNPYAVVQMHQIFQQSQAPARQLVTIEGEPFYYNIGAMNTWNGAKTFKRSDIPPDLSGQLFADLFHGMEERLREDPGFTQYIADEKYDPEIDPEEKERLAEQERLEHQMDPNYTPRVPPTFNQLKNNFLLDPYILGLLRLPVGANEEISADQYQLYAIIAHLQKQDSTRREGELLSPQEQMLLQYSRYIWFCLTGKKEGIRNVYRLIPDSISLEEATQGEKLIEKWTYKFFVDQIERVLESESFLKALLMKDSVADKLLNHQSDFLKYRFGKLVGLNPEIKLDFWTQTFYPEIHYVTEEEFLETFYQFFDISSIIQKYSAELTEKFSNILIHSKSPKGGVLYQHLERLMGREIRDAVSLDDDGFMESLTPKGKEFIHRYYKNALHHPLMILESPNLRKMSAQEIISFIQKTGRREIDLSQCSHLSAQEVEQVQAMMIPMTLEQLQQEYPTLNIMGNPFRKDGKGALEGLPPFQGSAGAIRTRLNQLLKAKEIDQAAGLSLIYETGEETLDDVKENEKALGLEGEPVFEPIQAKYGAKKNPHRGWVLISNAVLKRSRGRSQADQEVMVKNLGGELPSLWDACGLTLAMYKCNNQKKLFDDMSYTTTCSKWSDDFLLVGAFMWYGLHVDSRVYHPDPSHDIGVVFALRNF